MYVHVIRFQNGFKSGKFTEVFKLNVKVPVNYHSLPNNGIVLQA